MSSTPVAERSNEVERQVSDTPNSPYRPVAADGRFGNSTAGSERQLTLKGRFWRQLHGHSGR